MKNLPALHACTGAAQARRGARHWRRAVPRDAIVHVAVQQPEFFLRKVASGRGEAPARREAAAR